MSRAGGRLARLRTRLSSVTGWHYAVDGYMGAGLALACFWLGSRGLARPVVGRDS